MNFRKILPYAAISSLMVLFTKMYIPILSPYVKGLGYSEAMIGIIFSAFPFIMIFVAPIFGKLSDVMGRKKLMIMGMIMHGIAPILYFYGQSPVALIFGRLVDACGVAAFGLVFLAKIEDMLENKTRGKFMGIIMGVESVGGMLAPIYGAYLADMYFVRSPFIVSSFCIMLMMMVLYFYDVEPNYQKNKISKSDFNFFKGVKDFMSHEHLRVMGFLGVVMHAKGPALYIFLPLFLISKFDVGYTQIGIVYFILSLMHVFQGYAGFIADKVGHSNSVVIGCIMTGLIFMLLPFMDSLYLIYSSIAVYGLFAGLWNISAWSLMSDVGEDIGKEGEVVGSYMSIAKIGDLVATFISGILIMSFGYNFLFVLNGILVIFVSLIAFKMFSFPITSKKIIVDDC